MSEAPKQDDWNYRPAGDLGLPPSQGLRSVRREPGLIGLAGQYGCRLATRCLLQGYHRLRIEGRENLPASGPFIFIANHSSHLDAVVLAAALPWTLRQDAYPIAAGDTFFQKQVTSWLSATLLNALPMWRRSAGRHAMQDLRQRLREDGCIFILFPEGTRTRTGELGSFKPGIGMLAAGSAVPVVPACISGAFEAWPPDARAPRPCPVRLRIGTPLAMDGYADDKAGWKAVAADLETAVRALGDRARSCDRDSSQPSRA